jgi:hypothetical protein
LEDGPERFTSTFLSNQGGGKRDEDFPLAVPAYEDSGMRKGKILFLGTNPTDNFVYGMLDLVSTWKELAVAGRFSMLPH